MRFSLRLTSQRSGFSWGTTDVTSLQRVNGDSSKKIADKLLQNSSRFETKPPLVYLGDLKS